jgi:hypothetical protein
MKCKKKLNKSFGIFPISYESYAKRCSDDDNNLTDVQCDEVA